MTDYSQEQVGGSHYKDQAIQPLELSALVYPGSTQAAFILVSKYLGRKKTSYIEDVKKAQHIVEFTSQLLDIESSEHLLLPLKLWIRSLVGFSQEDKKYVLAILTCVLVGDLNTASVGISSYIEHLEEQANDQS